MPLWFGAVVFLAAAPAAVMPFVPGFDAVADSLGMLWTLYPIYVVATAICACLSYTRRREVAWILVAVMLLAHTALILLAREYAV